MTRIPIQTLIWVVFSLLVWPWHARAQVVINEVLVKNESTIRNSIGYETYVELYNLSSVEVSLAGWTLTDAVSNPGKFSFPTNAVIPANGYVLVWCDEAIFEPGFHAAFKFKENGDDLTLFNGTNQVDQVAFGLQATDLSICRIPNGNDSWQAGRPTPGNTNQAMAMGTPMVLRINEWLAASSRTDDWIELYNPASNGPVALGGMIIVDSTNSAAVVAARPIPELSFINSNRFLRFWADDLNSKAADHLGFKLGKSGDLIALFGVGGVALLDSVSFGAQTTDISMGRLPDGNTNITAFPLGSSSPEYSNYQPITNVVINELLAHTDPPLEDAVEFYNPTAVPVDLSHWWLSNDQSQPQKYRFPANTVVGPFGFKVFYEYTSWNRNRTGIFPEFTFNAAHGGELVLSAGNSLGNLTGYRVIQSFGASLNGVAFGRHAKSDGKVDFVTLPDLSLGSPIRASSPDTPQNRLAFESGQGAPNPAPLVGPIVISEIMYHPPDYLIGTNLVDNIGDEFIGLHNLSTNDVPLYDPAHPTNTWRLRDAVDFDFPPGTVIPAGGFLAVLPFDPNSNPFVLAAFYHRYHIAPATAILGPYVGKLANKGDNLELQKPDNPNVTEIPYVLVERVDYLPADPWPNQADGSGYSLHRINSAGYANDPTNWLAAAATLIKPKPGLVINEILARAEPQSQAAIEIVNTSAAPVDLSNWWLSNDRAEPQKYRIPTNTIIAPYGFKVFYESEFNPDGSGEFPAFTLASVQGGEVVLVSADADGNLIGDWLVQPFGPTETGGALGRYVNSYGAADFVPMSSRSLGVTNPGPLVGPIVISEIMYHPADLLTYSDLVPFVTNNTVDEFIELQNLSANIVPLYSTANHVPQQFTNTWQLANAVQFNFPLFVSLPPNGRLLVVNFDPTANPSQQIEFRLKYNVPSTVRLLGPLVGALNNRSATVELLQPGPVETPPSPDAGLVPYRLVDKISYEDRAPWPTNTDGSGRSLQRILLTGYANDPTNWYGAPPTAGRHAQLAAHIIQPPPSTLTVAAGSNVTLAASADGVRPIGYQWFFNGLALMNEITNNLFLNNVQLTNQGDYQLVASNAFGRDTSGVVRLELAVGPSFLVQPSNAIVMLGEPLPLTATVNGTPPFGFIWRRSGTYLATNITSGCLAAYAIPNALMSDAGLYQVRVTNMASVGGVASLVGNVAVAQPLGDRMVVAGSNLTIQANVAASGAWFYQWQFNGANLDNATNTSLVLTNVQPDQGGAYQLLISLNSAFTGTVRSVACQLAVQTVATAPQIIHQPQSLRIALGSRALLKAEAAGTDPLIYQWWHNQTNQIESGTNSFLAFTKVTAEQFGAYTIVVSNQAGVVTSQVVRLIESTDTSMAPGLSPLGMTAAKAAAFAFETISGVSYQVQYKNDLSANEWISLGPPYAGDGKPVLVDDPVNADFQRFYRVLVLP